MAPAITPVSAIGTNNQTIPGVTVTIQSVTIQ
jgi:hypothetical protein